MKTVLIIGENLLYSKYVSVFLEKYRCSIIANVKTINDVYGFIGVKLDILIIDNTVPIADSLNAIKKIKHINKNIRIIMIISKDQISIISEVIIIGVEAVVIN